MPDHLTTGRVAALFGAPSWKVRRIVDSLAPDVPRVGLYTLMPRELLGQIAIKLLRSYASDKAATASTPAAGVPA
jgi:hypothetical protein